LNGLFKIKNGNVAPIFKGTANYQLDDHLVGQLEYKASFGLINSSMSTALSYEKENFNLNVRFQLSVKNTFINFNVSKSFRNNDLKVKTNIQYGYLGASLTYGIEKQVTQFSRVDASIVIHNISGVSLNIEYFRFNFILIEYLKKIYLCDFKGCISPLNSVI
jgi:hypothetical protein